LEEQTEEEAENGKNIKYIKDNINNNNNEGEGHIDNMLQLEVYHDCFRSIHMSSLVNSSSVEPQ
jgi:hypothetical protein